MRPQKNEFETMVAQYESRIFNLVYRIVGDYDEASDLVQETFIRAFRAFDRFRGDAQHYTWLYRIAVNVSRDHLSKRQRIRSREVSLEKETETGESRVLETADERYMPSTILENKEIRNELDNAINELAEGYRECILLREMEDMSYDQIAETMGITVEAVRSRLARARAFLRERLAPMLRQD